ncbi:MAG: HNH endonuclease domain-containing protein [Pseudomonadota bacterium]
MRPAPTDGFQLDFLRKLQRLFNEGQFVATYKFALLNAIADLAVECEDDTDGGLTLSLELVAEKFIELYWRHSLPFVASGGSAAGLLVQNNGIQAGVLNLLDDMRTQHGVHTLAGLRAHRLWSSLVKKSRQIILKMPLWKLQFISGAHENFLYAKTDSTLEIRLNPGIPHCLRLFHPLVLQLTRQHWLEHIRAIPANQPLIGNSADLELFLFGEERVALAQASAFLHDLQQAQCFYCGKRIQEGAQVDHFIPWSRYPRDLGFNFVLAHAKCNQDKRDTLASQPHVERWLERNDLHRREITGHLSSHFPCDSKLTYRVAHWAYRLDKESSARLWGGVNDYASFQQGIPMLLEAALLKESHFGLVSGNA